MSAATAAKLRLAVVVLVAAVAQTTVAADLRVLGVAPDVLLLLAICAGLVAGAETGCLFGFGAGLVADAFLTGSPFGLSVLTYCLIGFGVGTLRNNVLPDSWLLTPIVAFVATVAGVLGFVALGDLVGQTGPNGAGGAWVVRVAVIEGVWGAALSVAVYPLFVRCARGLAAVEQLAGRPDRRPAG